MTGSDEIGLMWFRRDLRLEDNPAWAAATSERRAVVPLFVLDPRLLDAVGPFRRRQMLANLQSLDYDLFERGGGRLLVRIGDPTVLVPEAAEVYQAGAVYYNADVTPFATRRDEKVAKALTVPTESWYGSLVQAPGRILTSKGTLSRIFTPFYKSWKSTAWDEWPEPGDAMLLDNPGESLPVLDGPSPFPEGEGEAHRRLEAFLEIADTYDELRDRPDLDSTSRLSTDLRFGTLSPRAVVRAVGDTSPGRVAFLRQLAWRDWYSHLLLEVPTLPDRASKERFDGMAWRNDPTDIAAWKGGFTGYPIVDAGMRQLRETGWMPNRLRMICASFLVKNLLVDWRIGEAHFRHLLVDGDVPLSAGNWQWVAGTGPDASPYNRVLNPVSQSRKYDPDGAYIRRWVPELADLDGSAIHAPWESGATLGGSDDADDADGAAEGDYPEPVVDLKESRDRAIEAYATAVNEAKADPVATEEEQGADPR